MSNAADTAQVSLARPEQDTRRPARSVALGLGLATSAALLFLASAAQASHGFCEFGTGAGQCVEPRGVAVDQSNGEIYVADSGNSRIAKFDSEGDFLFAFGWGVDTGAQELEVCTTASGCQKGISGSGAGQFSSPVSIAVDNDAASPAYRDVYVGPEVSRLQRFDLEGEFLRSWGWDVVDNGPGDDVTPPEDEFEICVLAAGDTCKAGIFGNGAGQFGRNGGLAVGPEGIVHVGRWVQKPSTIPPEFDSWVLKFGPSGELVDEATLESSERLQGIAVDSDSEIYANFRGVHKYPPSGGAPIDNIDPDASSATGGEGMAPLAIDPADNLYVVQFEQGFRAIGKYDVSGASWTTLARFAYTDGRPWRAGLTPHHTPGEGVFISDAPGGIATESEVSHIPQSQLGPIIAPGTVRATGIGNTQATLEAEVNPEGKATEYAFQYVDEEAFETEGWEGPSTRETELESLGAEDFFLHSAEAMAGCPDPVNEAGLPESPCLTPETTYRIRVIADNADGEAIAEGEETFETLPPLEIKGAWSTQVGTDSAKLHASIDPLGIPATAHFEYVKEAAFEVTGFTEAERIPSGEGTIDFGAGEGPAARSAQLHSLEPATTYRYRVVADNPLVDSIEGDALAFTTFAVPAPPPDPDPCPNAAFRTGASAFLPDCRAHELVSPLDKEGGDIVVQASPQNFPASHNQSAEVGSKFTYSTYRSFGDAESAPYSSQYIATRTPDSDGEWDPGDGWSSHAVSPRRGISVLGAFQALDSQFKLFSPDLCAGWLLHDTHLPLTPDAVPGYANLYERDNCGAGAGSYEALTTQDPFEDLEPKLYVPELQGVSADGSHAVFLANAKLTGEAKTGTSNAYVASGGELRLACVLTGGDPTPTDCSAGTRSGFQNDGRLHAVHNAISDDGSRIYWSAGDQLYLRTNPMREQSALEHGSGVGTGDLAEGSATVSSLIAAAGKGSVSAGSPVVSALETTTGRFVEGQPITGFGIAGGTTILSCAPKCGLAAESLTLSKNAFATIPSAPISSRGPEPFAVGQTITGPGIPSGTTIVAAETGSLTLSAPATETQTEAELRATSPCSDPEKACTVAIGPGQYWTASADGSRALYTTPDGELRAFDAAAQESEAPIAGEVEGLLGASEDALRIYLVSREDRDGEGPAQAGEPNLYLFEERAPTFVGRLSEQDMPQARIPSPIHVEAAMHLARVTPSGSHAAFMSTSSMTDYDNTDASSLISCGESGGRCAAEVYLYDADAEDLRCVSCNPSGARPVGRELEVEVGKSTNLWAAAQIPTPENQLYAERVLSTDGERLFFESQESLVLRDTNGTAQDLYQWEALGKGSCGEADPSFSSHTGGCVSLISSGQSPEDSEFLDANASGSDVYFATGASLRSHDPGQIDVYDAKVGGGLPPPPPTSTPCEGEACQSPPPAPVSLTPGSSSYRGPGDLLDPRPAFSRCKPPARAAKTLAKRARRAKRATRRAKGKAGRRVMRRRSVRLARRAKAKSRAARSCRARVRRARAR